MAKITSFNAPSAKDLKQNPLKAIFDSFLSMDLFTRAFVVITALLIIATPFIINNLQIFNPSAQILPQAILTTTTYTVDNSIFPNPERGFHSPAELVSGNSLPTSEAKAAGNTLIHTNFRLDSFRTSALSTTMLNTITNALNAARTQKIKLIIRFMYNAGPWPTCQPDASETWIHTHLTQLKPILEANADVIAAFDAGFIGCWGEWHTSTNNLTEINAKTRVIKDILANFPSSRQIQMRTPAHIRDVWSLLTESERKRIGHNNDCFLASADDEGTYTDPPADKAYLATLGENAIIGGETCAVSSRTVCSTATAEMQQMHYSHINDDYNPDVIQGWRTGGCFDTIKKNLGYRLYMQDATYPILVAPGENFPFQATIRNDGYGSLYNPRPVIAVLYNAANSYGFLINTDPRTWKSQTTNTINQTITIPATTVPGTYKLALWLPDETINLRLIPAYSVRFANFGTWDSSIGLNILATNIVVSSTSTITPTSVPPTPTNAPLPPTPTTAPSIIPTSTPILSTPTPFTPTSTPTPTSNPQASTITIYAAGTIYKNTYPTMRLQILDTATNSWNSVQTWTNINGNANNREFKPYTYIYNKKIIPSQVRVRFVNDAANILKTEDRNLRIDKINIDGVDYQTEASSVYISSCSKGYLLTEWLHCNGYLQY